MIRFLCILLSASALLVAQPATGSNKTPVWEIVAEQDSTPRNEGEEGASDKIDVETRDGIVYISTTQPTTIKVYTILGQLITSKSVGSGTVRLTLGVRGVYILKAGTATRRINL